MTFVVPFDGSEYAEAALVRARDLGKATGESVSVITVIPRNNVEYAREKGWIGPTDAFDLEAIAETLRARVHDIAPLASFHYELCTREPSGGLIAKPVRKFARREGASMVFVGSPNAGRITTSLSSVGGRVGTDSAYDVVIVRRLPSET